jgi:hypothetical protein
MDEGRIIHAGEMAALAPITGCSTALGLSVADSVRTAIGTKTAAMGAVRAHAVGDVAALPAIDRALADMTTAAHHGQHAVHGGPGYTIFGLMDVLNFAHAAS